MWERDIRKGAEREADPVSSLEQKHICGLGREDKDNWSSDHVFTWTSGKTPLQDAINSHPLLLRDISELKIQEQKKKRTRAEKEKEWKEETIALTGFSAVSASEGSIPH